MFDLFAAGKRTGTMGRKNGQGRLRSPARAPGARPRKADSARNSAQTLDNHLGKVIRIAPDGSVPHNRFCAETV